MRHKTEYELAAAQVVTPEPVVSLFWNLIRQRRQRLHTVLDMGAGDCRFAKGGLFDKYIGVEIDTTRTKKAVLSKGSCLLHGCVFRHPGEGYDACIGNPPYVRHHDIEATWKEKTADRIKSDLGITLNKHCNLYIYFMCLGLMKTKAQGLVALIIPFEWVSRPSCRAVREYITQQCWNVDVYRFRMPVFEGVLTTASISIIDRHNRSGQWAYHDVLPTFATVRRDTPVASCHGVLNYETRGQIWALRGLSPGTQRVFTLTEGDRVHFGLGKRDVVPCVTTLKHVPHELRILNNSSFKRYFIDAGERCWLIKSYATRLSAALESYLAAIPTEQRDTYTCRNQEPWYRYVPHPIPRLLVSSAFITFGPKILENQIGASAVGSVYGIYGRTDMPIRRLQKHLLDYDFEKRIVAHARTLRKIEVGQLNAVLNAFREKDCSE